MYKPISEQIKAVKIKPEYELTGNQLLELKNGSGDFYQAIYNAFKFDLTGNFRYDNGIERVPFNNYVPLANLVSVIEEQFRTVRDIMSQ